MRLQKSKLLQFFFALFLSVWGFNFQTSNVKISEVDQLKMAAFEILKMRCNTCHITQNPGKVFTLEIWMALPNGLIGRFSFSNECPRGEIEGKK
jgi:hypothetical protein